MAETGVFITFESIDGLGKTTQVRKLVQSLTELGYDVFETKEPGDANKGSNIGKGVRNLVFKDPTTLKMRPGVADMLFLADHIQTAGDVAEAVSQGKVVISDRYADSQWAYNASEGKKCPDWALKIYGEQYGIEPDLTILLIARGLKHVGIPYTVSAGSPIPVGTILREDISWALSRGKARQGDEAGKQDGKAWNTVEDQRRIQDAYLQNLNGLDRTWTVDVWDHTTARELAATILGHVTNILTVGQVQKKAA
jgi:dTMP kinase